MKNVIDNIWKSVNIILIVSIIASALYIYIVNPGAIMGEHAKDVSVKDVRQNANYPQTVAWGNGFVQDQFVDTNDPYGVTTVAAANDNYIQSYDPYGIQQIARTDTNTANTQKTFTDKILQEGHWIGLEVIPLTSTIAAANNIPDNISGTLVDEVTLISAQSGLLAGDVITAISGVRVADLKSFKAATWQVASSTQATVTVYRNGEYLDIPINAGEQLGIAQMEAAPMILPIDVSPHGYYGPCDKCHTISKSAKNTGQLRKDAGDVLTVAAPPIQWGAEATHRNRGTCTNCHTII
jgi:hypothetical protein